MVYVTGTDSNGQSYWMNHRGEWDSDPVNAKAFRIEEAEKAVLSTINRNRHLDRSEQIEPNMKRDLFS